MLLPAILALVLTAAAVLGFVLWSTANIDQRAFERQSAMVAQVIEARRLAVQHDQEAVSIWDDAVVNTARAFDFEWVHINLGLWMYEFFGHDRTVVLDGAGRPLYVMADGASLPPDEFQPLEREYLPITAQLRGLPVVIDEPQAFSDFIIIEDRPAVVAATAIVTDTGELAQEPGTEAVMISVLFLDEAVASQLAHDYLFEEVHFSQHQPANPARAVYPLFNQAGRFIAFFEWERDRPGLLLLRQMVPVLAAGFVVAAIVFFLLLRQLHRSSTALETGRLHAEYQAAHDKLTGLPNRMNFDRHLAGVINDTEATGRQITLLMLDLDRFKQVNDTLGHQAGDELIRAVADRLRTVVGDRIRIARLGGDEFALTAVGPDVPPDPLALSSRVIDALSQPFDLSHFQAHVGASIGIVSTTVGDTEPHELVRKADIALYEAKATGRNRAVVYEEHMNELLQLQHTIEGELREALRRTDQLSVAFQPLVDQQTRKVIGAEALARWHHPKFGQISPARFIPIAESTGLIEALGEVVLQRACEMGATVPGRTMAVNISPAQLRNPGFPGLVFDILRRTGMRAADLELEITESILLDDEHVSAQTLHTFRAAGIHIALDDFGTGYSSLSYLKRYPVDRIKIDRSFVSQLAEGHVSVAITQAIVTLAHAMEIEVTAEGVETEGQAAILGRLGCNTLQGFLFSGAVSPDRIAAIFAEAARDSRVA